MIRPPLFSEVARRSRLYNAEFADEALGRRRYSDPVLVAGDLDTVPFVGFFYCSRIETAIENGWRLFAVDAVGRYSVVAVGGWRLPLSSLAAVLTADGVVADFDGQRIYDRRQLL